MSDFKVGGNDGFAFVLLLALLFFMFWGEPSAADIYLKRLQGECAAHEAQGGE